MPSQSPKSTSEAEIMASKVKKMRMSFIKEELAWFRSINVTGGYYITLLKNELKHRRQAGKK